MASSACCPHTLPLQDRCTSSAFWMGLWSIWRCLSQPRERSFSPLEQRDSGTWNGQGSVPGVEELVCRDRPHDERERFCGQSPGAALGTSSPVP